MAQANRQRAAWRDFSRDLLYYSSATSRLARLLCMWLHEFAWFDERNPRHTPIIQMKQPPPISHPRDPLHGITLETIITQLVERYGWAEMGRRVPIRCFLHDPSVKSSLTFLRKTPWARERVEGWYIAYKDM